MEFDDYQQSSVSGGMLIMFSAIQAMILLFIMAPLVWLALLVIAFVISRKTVRKSIPKKTMLLRASVAMCLCTLGGVGFVTIPAMIKSPQIVTYIKMRWMGEDVLKNRHLFAK